MSNLHNLTVAELRKAVAIKEQIEALQSELDSIIGGEPVAVESAAPSRGRKARSISAAGRARISAAQKARWAKAKRGAADSNGDAAPAEEKKKRKVSRAARAKLSAAAKARWARARATGQSKL
jgi:hypothetical protein